MAFRDRATLLDALPIAAGDTPGAPAGARFLALGEPAKAERFNRALGALAENDDFLYDITSTKELASTEVGAFNLVIPTSTLVIDPTGVGGVVSYVGTLYMGEAGWADNQENRDTLFQLLDSNYNEVIVDGVEVKVSAVAGSAIGDGFVAVATTLTLNKTIPVGGYRLAYGRGRTYETLPAYAFIRGDIRGLHEAPGEVARRSFVVVDSSSSPSEPADYKGATSISDAIADGFKNIFVRAGVYGPYTSLTLNGVTLVGAGIDTTTIQMSDTNGRVELTNYSSVSDLSFVVDVAPVSTSIIQLQTGSVLRRVDAEGFEIQFTGNTITVEDIRKCGGVTGILALGSAYNVRIRNLLYDPQYITGVNALFTISSGSNMLVENVRPATPGTVVAQSCLQFTSGAQPNRISFRNCYFETGDGIALYILNDLQRVTFDACEFYSEQTLIYTPTGPIIATGCYFRACSFKNTATAWYRTEFVRLSCFREPATTGHPEGGFVVDDCYFYDKWCVGDTDATDPGGVPAGGGTPFSVMKLEGVVGRGVRFDRYDLDYIVTDAEWLYLGHCNIDGLHVSHQHAPDGAIPFTYGTSGTGLIRIESQSYVKDLTLALWVDSDTGTYVLDYTRGIIAVTGGDYVGSTWNSAFGRTIVEGVYVALLGDAKVTVGGVLGQGSGSTVRGFVWPRASTLAPAGQPTTNMILLDGERIVFEDYDVYIDTVTDNYDLYSLIKMGTAQSQSSIRVGRGKVYTKQNGATNRLTYLVTAICSNGVLDGMEAVVDSSVIIDLPLLDFTGAILSKVVNSHVRVTGSAPNSGGALYNLLKFSAGTFDIALGNMLHVNGGGNTPEISPNTVTGYANNNLLLNAAPAQPGA